MQQNEDFLIQIKLDKVRDLSTAHIEGEWRLMQLLSSYEALIAKVLHHSKLFVLFNSVTAISLKSLMCCSHKISFTNHLHLSYVSAATLPTNWIRKCDLGHFKYVTSDIFNLTVAV